MPERMWRVASALLITWVDVLGVNNVLVSLWNLGDSSGQLVKIWGDHGSEVVEDWVVKEGYWDEELLPGESPSNLDKHTDESHTELFLILMGNSDAGNSLTKLWKIMFINELS